jgi:hypothetical protein
MTIFQHFYLNPKVQISGTIDEELLNKERKSIKSSHVLITNTSVDRALSHESLKKLDLTKDIFRLYKMNRLMN